MTFTVYAEIGKSRDRRVVSIDDDAAWLHSMSLVPQARTIVDAAKFLREKETKTIQEQKRSFRLDFNYRIRKTKNIDRLREKFSACNFSQSLTIAADTVVGKETFEIALLAPCIN